MKMSKYFAPMLLVFVSLTLVSSVAFARGGKGQFKVPFTNPRYTCDTSDPDVVACLDTCFDYHVIALEFSTDEAQAACEAECCQGDIPDGYDECIANEEQNGFYDSEHGGTWFDSHDFCVDTAGGGR